MNDGGAAATVGLRGEGVGAYLRMLGQKGMHGGAELTYAFAVNDAELVNAAFAAEFDVVEHDRLYTFRAEGVEIKNAIDG